MGKHNIYTPEMQDFLRRHSSISRLELTELFNKEFNTDKTVHAIRSFTKSKGWVDNSIRYTPEMIEFLSEWSHLPIAELTKAFNSKFNTNKAMRHLTKTCQRLGIECNTIRHTQAELDFIREHSALPRQELADAYNIKFNAEKTSNQVKAICQRYGWLADDDGKYKPGHTSWQTGLDKEEFKSHYTHESMQKMISPMIEGNKKLKVGDTTIKSGVLYEVISVDYSLPFEKRLVSRRRIIWEREKGPIPESHLVINLDGNPINCDIENLRCIPKDYIPILNSNKWMKSGPAILDSAIKYCELLTALKQNKLEKETH